MVGHADCAFQPRRQIRFLDLDHVRGVASCFRECLHTGTQYARKRALEGIADRESLELVGSQMDSR